jgi:hypothetical protein
MIERRTVLVVGAGASIPYKLPSGRGLRDLVLKRADDAHVLKAITSQGLDPIQYRKFLDELRTSGFSSVDAFLEERAQWIPYGKTVMAECLLRQESAKYLFPPHQPTDHWLEVLWQRLRSRTWEEFRQNQLSIISFNYDRLIEHYLFTVCATNYGIDYKTFKALRLITYVHGNLGNLKRDGQLESSSDVRAASQMIRIIHEAGDSREFARARNAIRQANAVLFLGFGYHSGNMKKLAIARPARDEDERGRLLLGTSKGLDKVQWSRICQAYMPTAAYWDKYTSISILLNTYLH